MGLRVGRSGRPGTVSPARALGSFLLQGYSRVLVQASGGPGLVAAGEATSGEDLHAAVWVSPPPG